MLMIIIAGPHGAGKTTIAKMLTEHKFDFLDLGGILRGKQKSDCPNENFKDWCANKEKIHGLNFTDDIVVEEINNYIYSVMPKLSQKPQDIIIVGSRSLRGINYITQKVKTINGHENIIIYIDAPFNILFSRYCEREKKQLAPMDFQKLLDDDDKNGLMNIIPYANVKMTNNGSLQQLKDEIENIMFNNLGYFR